VIGTRKLTSGGTKGRAATGKNRGGVGCTLEIHARVRETKNFLKGSGNA